MTTPFNPKRPKLLLRSHGQRPDGRTGKGRARREKFLDLSNRLASRRLKAIVREAERRQARRQGLGEPDCRERYLRYLTGGVDCRYTPFGPFGPET